MPKSISAPKSFGYTLPTIPQCCAIDFITGESKPYGSQQMPKALFEAVLAEAPQFLGSIVCNGGH